LTHLGDRLYVDVPASRISPASLTGKDIMARYSSAAATAVLAAATLLAGPASAATIRSETLLAIDQDRAAVIERIVDRFGGELAKSGAGIDAAQLRAVLQRLRADHLLAASVAGSVDALRDVVARSLTSSSPVSAALATPVMAGTASGVKKIAAIDPGALGDAAADLVYTPVAPCRLFDTRTSQGGAGTPALNVLLTVGVYTPEPQQGGPGGCTAPAGATVALVSLGTLLPASVGLVQGGAQGQTSFTNALLQYQPGDQYGATVAMPLNPANGQFVLVEWFGRSDLYGDLLGYFRAPGGGYVSSVGAGTGISVTGSASAPVVGIANGGVGTAQIADNAVTEAKRAWSRVATVSGQGVAPTSTLAFVSAKATLVLNPLRPVLVIASMAFGSTAGATALTIDVCYQKTSGGALTAVGNGLQGLTAAAGQRHDYAISGVVLPLSDGAGEYEVGMCGSSTDGANWNANGDSAVTAVVL